MRRTYRRRPRTQEQEKKFRINRSIQSAMVMLIDDEGEFRGEMETAKALALAEEAGLDLIEVNPSANPPVARIADYGQFKYERDKKTQKQKAHQKKSEIKGIRLSIRIGEHDLAVRREQAKRFVEKGNKLRLELQLRGRERQHPELARQVIEKFAESLSAVAGLELIVEEPLTRQGAKFTMVLASKS